jgi:hypothetical protein
VKTFFHSHLSHSGKPLIINESENTRFSDKKVFKINFSNLLRHT